MATMFLNKKDGSLKPLELDDVPVKNPNIALWESVEKTDPSHTKEFKRGGGFSGTAIKPLYTIKRATEIFGLVGTGWGWHELENKVIGGVWCSKVLVWYMHDNKRGEIEQWGQTLMQGTNKNGAFVDEEAPKKAITDAVAKCLSYLGFSADIHMGRFDDSKYVEELKKEFAPAPAPVVAAATATFETDKQYLMAAQDVESLKTYFDGVKKRKDSFHEHEYAELVTITANKNKQFKGEL